MAKKSKALKAAVDPNLPEGWPAGLPYNPPKPKPPAAAREKSEAWEPFRDEGKQHAPLFPEVKPIPESDPAFIGPKTSGDYREEALCESCFTAFESLVCVLNLREMFRSKFCAACVEIEAERQRKLTPEKLTRLEKWRANICPPAYAQTDVARLKKEGKLTPAVPAKMACGAFVDMILARPFSERGVGIIGDIRLGKTRLLFKLLERYYCEGKQVSYVYAPDFSDVYAALMGESPAKGNAYLERAIAAEIWFLDDLGKGRLSEPAQRALLRVIEKRTNQLRPIFVTANNDGETLITRMRYEENGQESEYARPMVERLREFCDFHQI